MSPKSPPIPHAAWRNPVCFVALGFGAGGLPKAPGTWGTLLALPFYLLFMRLPFLEYVDDSPIRCRHLDLRGGRKGIGGA